MGLPVQEISELVRRVAREPEAQREPLAGRDALHTMLVFGARREHVQAAAPRLDCRPVFIREEAPLKVLVVVRKVEQPRELVVRRIFSIDVPPAEESNFARRHRRDVVSLVDLRAACH